MAERDKLSQTMRIDLTPEVLEAWTSQKAAKAGERKPRRTPGARYRIRVPGTAGANFQELFQSVYDAALITDLGGHIVETNTRALRFLLYAEQDLRALNAVDVIAGADASLMETLRRNLRSDRFTLIQAYCMRRDGTLFPAEIAVNRLRLSGRDCLCFFIRDVTLRRQAEQRLLTEHNAIQNASNGIAIADREGRIEYVNAAVARLWGCAEPAEVLGRNVADLWEDRAAAAALVRAVGQEHATWHGELVARRQDGGRLAIEVSAAPNRDADGTPIGMVLSLMDLSDRKRAEEAGRESERHRVMLESLGAACHHFSQPVTVLLANLEAMRKRVADGNGDMRELIESSVKAADGLTTLLHRMTRVNEYRTTRYLESQGEPGSEDRIIEI